MDVLCEAMLVLDDVVELTDDEEAVELCAEIVELMGVLLVVVLVEVVVLAEEVVLVEEVGVAVSAFVATN